ncbi:helix-turn-helix transcriptional regulator [Ornithinimicrobium panacihumi]|uniref:helix-turn-helix transcriptional regulator n=1 Tax=Ornithinimicrobium panacihumi TaxID=2008449 RepID=UPI003F8978C8
MEAASVDPRPRDDQSWAAALVARRRELGLRQSDLAELADVSERFVRELEAGKASVRLDKVRPVLDALGLQLVLADREVP